MPWIVDDGHDSLDLLLGQLAGSLVQIDIGLLADQVREATTDTLDRGQGEHHLPLALDVGVGQTQNVLEFICSDKRLMVVDRMMAVGSVGCSVESSIEWSVGSSSERVEHIAGGRAEEADEREKKRTG